MKLYDHYQTLLSEYGPQGWWPARTRTEMIIGAILTQNTAWTNVEKAIVNLRKHQALNFQTLDALPIETLTEWIRPAGTFNQKAVYLKTFAHHLCTEYSGSLNQLFRLDTAMLRKNLLALKGIGPETADCILLYAARRPVFVVDAYTRRFLAANGYPCEAKASYDEIARLVIHHLPQEIPLFNEYHALIVEWAKQHPAKSTHRRPEGRREKTDRTLTVWRS